VMAVAVFPLLLAILCLGAGLLVERAAGIRLPPGLLPVVGFAALVVVSQFTEWSSALAPATPWFLVALALGGFLLLGRRPAAARWRARSRGWWLAPASAIAAYLTVSAPVIAAGRLTSPGYLLDTTAAIQLTGAERLLHHGQNFTNGFPGYGATLVNYFGHGYPSGGHTTFAAVGWLSGQDLFWLYAPFQAAELALAALVLGFLASRAGLPRLAAAIAGWIAAVPALVYAYALQGSIKELTALPLLLLMGALVTLAPQLARRGIRASLPFALAAAGALASIGLAASPWVFLFGLAALVFAIPALSLRGSATRADGHSLSLRGSATRAGAYALALAGGTAILCLPTLARFSTAFNLATGLQSSDRVAASDPGNLLRPLRFVQTFGVWLGESHRYDPKYFNQTYLLIGLVVACVALGVVWLLRRGAWTVLAFVAIWVIVWEFLTSRGTEWTNAKMLMLLSPVVVLVALIGAFAAVGRVSRGAADGGGGLAVRRFHLESIPLFAAIVLAVLASDALAYHATGLSPTGRYKELRYVGQRFADRGPTLTPDFDEYAMYFLRKSEDDAPGYAYHAAVLQLDGASDPAYGASYDLDALDPQSVQHFRQIVMRRSPSWSRPPGNYALVWEGTYYEVWRQAGSAPKLHLPLGGGLQPVAIPRCGSVRRLARIAQAAGGALRVATRAPNVLINMGTAAYTHNAVPTWDPGEGVLSYRAVGPLRIDVGVRVTSTGTYRLWLGGVVDRPLRVLIDGRLVGTPSYVSGGNGNRFVVGTVTLRAGIHDLRFIRGGGSLHPGDNASTTIEAPVLEPIAAERDTVTTVSPTSWHSLCGRPADWIEVSA
jgi:hypothetical protein